MQVFLDRLLRDDAGNPLLAHRGMKYGAVSGSRVDVQLRPTGSPSYLRGLLEREFRLKGALAEAGAPTFELTDAKGEPLKTGTHQTIYLDVSKNPKFGGIGPVRGDRRAGGRKAAAAVLEGALPKAATSSAG